MRCCPMFQSAICRRDGCPWYSGRCRTDFIMAVNAVRLDMIRETIDRIETNLKELERRNEK